MAPTLASFVLMEAALMMISVRPVMMALLLEVPFGQKVMVPSPTNKFLVHKFIRILNYSFHYIFFILQKKTSAQKENIRGLLFALGFKSRLFLLVVGRLSEVAPLLFYRMLQVKVSYK